MQPLLLIDLMRRSNGTVNNVGTGIIRRLVNILTKFTIYPYLFRAEANWERKRTTKRRLTKVNEV